MATNYGARFSKAVGCTRHAMGGAAEGLGIEALAGDTDMVTVFDDFNGIVESDQFGVVGGDWETIGWMLADVGAPGADYVVMNDPNGGQLNYDSCILVVPGDTADTGGNMQLDHVTGAVAVPTSLHEFQHIWIPESAAGATILDNTSWLFACRIGLEAGDTTDGNWEGKIYIGWAELNDPAVLTATGVDMSTPIITQAETGPLVGFCIPEDGTINGISQRTVNTAYAEGTNFTQMLAAGGVDSTVANGADTIGDRMWFDLAVRMDIVDMDSATDNGTTRFYWRRVLPGVPLGDWLPHSTVLTNQTPNNDEVLVPTIEVVNGPAVVQECTMAIDWWAFGRNRVNR